MDPHEDGKENHPPEYREAKKFRLGEDWLSLLIAFLLIVLATIGILGKDGIAIRF